MDRFRLAKRDPQINSFEKYRKSTGHERRPLSTMIFLPGSLGGCTARTDPDVMKFLREVERGREQTKDGDYGAALATFEGLLETVDQVFENDPTAATTYFSTVVNAMLASLAVNGKFDWSLDLTEQAVRRVERDLGKNTIEWINARRSRALALCDKRRFKQARDIVESTLRASERIPGNQLTTSLRQILEEIQATIRQQEASS